MKEENAFSEIEKQLLKEGFVSSEEMAMAQKERDIHFEQSRKPIGLILLDQGKISQEQLQRLLSLPDVQKRIAKQALVKELVADDQFAECEQMGSKSGLSLSRLLVERGYLAENERKKLIYDQLDTIDFAKQAIRHQVIRESDLEAVLKLKTHQKSTCEILYERNLITLSELNHVFRKFSRDLKLGQILVQQRLVTENNLEKALSLQSSGNQTLGKILLEKGWIGIEQLYFALSIQYNTPFQKLDGYTYYEKQKMVLRNIVEQRYAIDNLIIPLFQNGNNLTLGVSNPANIWSMHGLKSMYPELQMNCVLITDEKFEQLYALLYGELLQTNIGRKIKKAETSAANGNVVISDPIEQKELVKTLYRFYNGQRPQTANGTPSPDEAAWFFEFIENSYRSICEKFGCSRVLYRCDVKDKRAHIFASPSQ